MHGKLFALFFVFMMGTVGILAQGSIEKVRKQKEEALKDIEYANKLLEETIGKTKESLQEINLINRKLTKRREYIVNLEAEAGLLSNSIDQNNHLILQLEEEIEKVNGIYAKMIYSMYKTRNRNNFAMFFLASENMNQLYKRIRYMRIYSGFLKAQRVRLLELKTDLREKNALLRSLILEKESVMTATRREYNVIQTEIAKKKQTVEQLKKRQKDIEKEIKEKEKVARKLDEEIRRIIEEEKRKTRGGAGRDILTPAERLVSNDFSKNQGLLPWPTQRGIVTGKYGEHDHPDFKSVKIRNDGVYISTGKGEYARSVFKGTVSRVFSIPGQNFTVIVKHGIYFTLYHNLIDVVVKAGQEVETKQIIGRVFTDEKTHETTLYFQLWKETERNDPELWLMQ